MDEKRAELEKILGDFWDENEIPTDHIAGSTESLSAPMDSLTAVEVLVEVDKLFDKKIKVDAVIQRGGYKDKAEFVKNLADEVIKAVKGDGQ